VLTLKIMKISQVTTSKKVATIIKRDDDSPDKIQVVWLNPKDKMLKDRRGRVYLLVINGLIYKIGGSQAAGGIKSTIQSYTNCMKGSPSDRTFMIHKLLRQELDLDNSVEIYMITAEPVMAPIPGLFGITEGMTSPFKEMESQCVKDYYQSQGCYPRWNYQESGTQYPQEFVEEFTQFKMGRTKKKSL
jgi:hypothetical protein